MNPRFRVSSAWSRIWFVSLGVVALALIALVALTFLRQRPYLVSWGTMLGEFAIAVVIYLEVEAERASRFMEAIKDPSFYEDRACLYDAYLRLTQGSLRDRARAFETVLWKEEKLRRICDRQWTELSRLRYMMRRSIHRGLLAK